MTRKVFLVTAGILSFLLAGGSAFSLATIKYAEHQLIRVQTGKDCTGSDCIPRCAGSFQFHFGSLRWNFPCDVMIWDGENVQTVPTPQKTQLNYIWTGRGNMVLQVCVDACDLWLWDGGRMTRLTNTPDFSEIAPISLP